MKFINLSTNKWDFMTLLEIFNFLSTAHCTMDLGWKLTSILSWALNHFVWFIMMSVTWSCRGFYMSGGWISAGYFFYNILQQELAAISGRTSFAHFYLSSAQHLLRAHTLDSKKAISPPFICSFFLIRWWIQHWLRQKYWNHWSGFLKFSHS